MKQLILYAHPNPGSFNHAILRAVIDALQEQGDEVRVRDLYEIGFNPVLSGADLAALRSGQIPAEIRTEQEHVAWADRLIVIYPLWWTGLPAILKGYVDRVFSFGFAYTVDAAGIVPLLKGKQALLLTTHGTPAPVYENLGAYEAFYKTIDRGIFEFCGFNIIAHRHFGAVPSAEDAVRKTYLQEVKTLLAT